MGERKIGEKTMKKGEKELLMSILHRTLVFSFSFYYFIFLGLQFLSLFNHVVGCMICPKKTEICHEQYGGRCCPQPSTLEYGMLATSFLWTTIFAYKFLWSIIEMIIKSWLWHGVECIKVAELNGIRLRNQVSQKIAWYLLISQRRYHIAHPANWDDKMSSLPRTRI